MKNYLPEGCLINTAENIRLTGSIAGLHEAMTSGKILEGRAALCDSEHNIIVDLPCIKGINKRTHSLFYDHEVAPSCSASPARIPMILFGV